MRCPCGSNRDFNVCCGPALRGEAPAPTAEALMRSRYSAYTRSDIGYIQRTLAPEHRAAFDAAAATRWATEADWQGLRIVATEKGQAEDSQGMVEFVATYKQGGKTLAHHEISRFRKTDSGEWLFVEGRAGGQGAASEGRSEKSPSPAHPAPKVGRNESCPCGSGKKYKKCCGA